MKQRLLTSHVQEGSIVRSAGFSLVGHLLLVGLILAGGYLLPQGALVDLGSGPGGGRGEGYIPVRLADPLETGGFDAVKPMLKAAPKAAPPPKPEKKESPPPDPPKPTDFVVKTPVRKEPPLPVERTPPNPAEPPKAVAGDILREPDPGAGGKGQPPTGQGAGMGIGVGVEVGEGRNIEGRVDSYYVRLVERRVGSNWLKSSFGELGRPVSTIITFEVGRDGRISEIQVVKPSGILTVDLAAERAVRASNPLPQLPLEFRGRSLRFRAEFNYPPQ